MDIKKKYNNNNNCNPPLSWKLPDDVFEHYQFLLNATKQFRTITIHSYLDYSGPWIENYYINFFINKPLEYFNGLIPLFIQFVDIHSFEFNNNISNVTYTFRNLSDYLISILRDDCIYIVVSQDDEGLSEYLYRYYCSLCIVVFVVIVIVVVEVVVVIVVVIVVVVVVVIVVVVAVVVIVVVVAVVVVVIKTIIHSNNNNNNNKGNTKNGYNNNTTYCCYYHHKEPT